MRLALIDGDTQNAYQPTKAKATTSDYGHALTAAVAGAAARAGWSRLQFQHVIFQSPARAGKHTRDIQFKRGHEKALSYLDRVWEKATELVERDGIGCREDAVSDLITLIDRIGSAHWRGVSMSSALRTLAAHWKAAYRAGGRAHTLAYREAAELAGLSTSTVFKATARLVDLGWLLQVNSGTAEHGSAWRLLDGPSQPRNTSRGRQAEGGTECSEGENVELDVRVIVALMDNDAFAHRGLGASSLKILAALKQNDSQTIPELVESASISKATAYRHLQRLAGYDLVSQVGEVWMLTETATEALSGPWDGWDEVSAALETAGTSTRRRARHEAQRKMWHEYTLPRLRERRRGHVTRLRGDEVEDRWVVDGSVIDPATGEIIQDLRVATDGRLILVEDEPDYDELVRRSREAELAYQAA